MKIKYVNEMKMKFKISGCWENFFKGVVQVGDYDICLIYKFIVEIMFFLLIWMFFKILEKFL